MSQSELSPMESVKILFRSIKVNIKRLQSLLKNQCKNI
jgi:hypothetical protein